MGHRPSRTWRSTAARFPHRADHQADREIRDIIGQHVGGIGYTDASLPSDGQIDAIVPHTVDGDDAELGQPCGQRGIDADMAAGDDCADFRRVVTQPCLAQRRLGPMMHLVERIETRLGRREQRGELE